MKTLFLYFCLLLIAPITNASTWTIHGTRDNYLNVEFAGYPPDSTSAVGVGAFWDLAWDQEFPQWSDSGSVTNDSNGWSYVSQGWREAWPMSLGLDNTFVSVCILSGPSPDYSGWVNFDGGAMATGGEFWIDFDSTGTARVSTSAPSDFGKWAWDGSINPNYVAPLATKKHHGKK